jgi:hypothetical protein
MTTFSICKETGVKLDEKHWYEHVPKPTETSQGGKVTILWNQQVQTDRTIHNNKPDIIICMLIDVAICGDRNVIKKKAEKILKFKTPYKRHTAHVKCNKQTWYQ